MIEHLRSALPRNNICLFIYFDFKDKEKYSLRNLYSSLLAQLAQQHRKLTKETQKALETSIKMKMVPSADEYLEVRKTIRIELYFISCNAGRILIVDEAIADFE